MLVKCVCSNCGHSYLADDQAGALACPRCGVDNEGARNPSDIPDAPGAYDAPAAEYGDRGFDGEVYDDAYADDPGYAGYEEPQFNPQAAPAMYITNDRLVRGIVFGIVATGTLGIVLGASLAAIRVAVPAALAIVLALVSGASCRYGFGGRAALRSKGRAIVVLSLVAMVGMAGFLTGSWLVERYTGDRADVTARDLAAGLHDLNTQRLRTDDEGEKLMIDQRIVEAQRLQTLSDAEIEDYLWTQQGQIKPPLLAWTKLRVTHGPAIRLGPDQNPVEVPEHVPAAILAGEFLLAVWLALRLVMVRR